MIYLILTTMALSALTFWLIYEVIEGVDTNKTWVNIFMALVILYIGSWLIVLIINLNLEGNL